MMNQLQAIKDELEQHMEVMMDRAAAEPPIPMEDDLIIIVGGEPLKLRMNADYYSDLLCCFTNMIRSEQKYQDAEKYSALSRYQLFIQSDDGTPETEHQVASIQMNDGCMFIEVNADIQWYVVYDSFLQAFKIYSLDTFYSFGSNLEHINKYQLMPFAETQPSTYAIELQKYFSNDLAAFILATFIK